MTIRLEWEPHGTLFYLSDQITFQDFLDLHKTYTNDVRIKDVKYSIFVYEPGAHFLLSDEQLDQTIALESEAQITERKIIWAVVTQDDDIKTQLAKMYFNNPIRLCDSLAEARTYIEQLLTLESHELDDTQRLVKSIMGLDIGKNKFN